MRKQKKLSARVVSLALTAAMACTMMPLNVLAITEGKAAEDSDNPGIIRSFDDLEEPFIQSATDKYVYSLSVELNTPFEDLDLPTELRAMVDHTSAVEKPEEEEPVQKPGEAESEDEITTEESTEAAKEETAAPEESTEAEETQEETIAPEESTEADGSCRNRRRDSRFRGINRGCRDRRRDIGP